MFWSGRVVVVGVSLAFAACLPRVEIPPDALISCARDDECPGDQTCSLDGLCQVGLAGDETGPTLERVFAESAVLVVAQLDEDVAVTTATAASSYAVDPYLEITGAALSPGAHHEVRLTVAPDQQLQDVLYTLTVVDVTDLAGNPIQIGEETNRLTFSGIGKVVDRSPPVPLTPARHASSAGNDMPLLSWSHPAGAGTFTVEVAREASFAADSLVTYGWATENHYLLETELAPGTYHWRVRADITVEDQWGVSEFDKVDQTFHVYCPAADSCGPPTVSATSDPESVPTVIDPETGATGHPYRSIARAMTAVAALAGSSYYDEFRPEIRVARRGAGESYDEGITLLPGVSLVGGYDYALDPAAWSRVPGSRTPVESESLVLVAAGLRSENALTARTETLVEGMSFASKWSGQPADPAPAVSTVVSIAESSAYLRLRDTAITAWADERAVGLSLANSGPDGTTALGPIVEQCEIRADTRAADAGVAVGVQVFGSAVTLRDNVIVAGETGAMSAVGIDSVVGLSCAADLGDLDQCPWQDNDVTAGAAHESYGVRLLGPRDAPALTLTHNRIASVGTQDLATARPVSVGLALVDGCVRGIHANRISGGSELDRGLNGPSTSSGLRITGSCSDFYNQGHYGGDYFQPIINNVIISLGGDAVYMSGSLANLVHNTLVVVADPLLFAGTTRYHAAIAVTTAAPIVTNNILARVGGVATLSFFFGVREENPCGNVSYFANNAFVGLTSLHLTRQIGAGGFVETQEVTVPNVLHGELTCGGFVDEIGIEAVAVFGTPYIDNFISPHSVAESFVDFDGIDDDSVTVGDNDYHLGVVAVDLAGQGRDTGAGNCGYCTSDCAVVPGAESCGDVTLDRDGLLRTAPVSVGAFEKN